MGQRGLWGLATVLLATVVSAAPLLNESFDAGMGQWIAVGEGYQVTVQEQVARSGSALQAEYRSKPGQLGAAARPVEEPLTGARTVRCWLRTSHAGILVIMLQEADESTYGHMLMTPAETWQELDLSLDRFRLLPDNQDENDRLDLDQVKLLAITDMSLAVPFVEQPTGAKQFWLDDFAIEPEDGLSAYSSNGKLPYLLENFEHDPLGWLAVGGRITRDADDAVLVWEYPGSVTEFGFVGCFGRLGHLPASAGYLLITLQSERPAKLYIGLQEEKRDGRDESRYYQMVDVPATRGFETITIRIADLQLDTFSNAGDENNRLDLDQVDSILIGDVGLMSGETPAGNTIWIDEIELVGN